MTDKIWVPIALDTDDGYADGSAQLTILLKLRKIGPDFQSLKACALGTHGANALIFEYRARRYELGGVPPIPPAVYQEERIIKFPKLRIGRHPHTVKGNEAFLSAVQQRFMPHVRRRLHALVQPAVYKSLKSEAGGAPVLRRDAELRRRLRRQANADADQLVAEFVQAFYPCWGRTTTPRTVRSARETRPA
jgi:hypothetical protein